MTGKQHKVVGAGFGVASAYIVWSKTKDPNAILLIPAAIAGSMLPDIDHDRTKLGRGRKVFTTISSGLANVIVYGGIALVGVVLIVTLLGIRNFGFSPTILGIVLGGLLLVAILRPILKNSKAFRWATKHRGLMHTLVVPALLILAIYLTPFPLWRALLLGLAVGYLSHLLADCITTEGCPIFFPVTIIPLRLPPHLKTKNKSCNVAAVVLAILAVVLAFVFF
jgi:inner membrane protein